MVSLGGANSRMKDFYDVWICSQHLDFKTDTLRKAIDATFKNRDPPVPTDEFEVLTTGFVEGHRVQWNAFVRKMGEKDLVDALGTVVTDLKAFALPALRALARGEELALQGKASIGWVAA
jgi:hypothetical protein